MTKKVIDLKNSIYNTWNPGAKVEKIHAPSFACLTTTNDNEGEGFTIPTKWSINFLSKLDFKFYIELTIQKSDRVIRGLWSITKWY